MKLVIIKDKLKLVKKLWYIVWATLFVMVILKLTFNYWQPYVIPNEKLQIISDFIDDNAIIKTIIDGLLFIINGTLIILCSIKRWWFKNKIQSIIIISIITLTYILFSIFGNNSIVILILTFGIPLILDYKKWKYTLLAFLLSNIFLFLSLWLEGFANSNSMQYVVKVFLELDYYIMLLLNYFVFNLLKKKV